MAGFLPGVTRFGENTQDMPTGALIQDRETGLLRVPSGVIVSSYAATSDEVLLTFSGVAPKLKSVLDGPET
jgi:hypothetical protein